MLRSFAAASASVATSGDGPQAESALSPKRSRPDRQCDFTPSRTSSTRDSVHAHRTRLHIPPLPVDALVPAATQLSA
jgi:hypothetical protein